MNAIDYLHTLKRMKEGDYFLPEEWLDFLGKTPEHKVEFVESWLADNPEPIKKRLDKFPPIDDYKEYIDYLDNVVRDIHRDLVHHDQMIQKLQLILFNEQLRIDDCEDDIEDLRGELRDDE